MALNPLFDALIPSPTLYINEQVSRLRQQGRQVFHLGFGESRFAVPAKLQQALGRYAGEKSYLPAQGLEVLREEIAGFYNRRLPLTITPQQVMVGPGSKALIYALQLALDAELLLPVPSWVSYAPQARLLNRKVHYIPATAASGYQFDLTMLDNTLADCTDATRLLIINSPNNPTGNVLTPQFLNSLADYCRANNILVLSDEIYALVNYGEIPQHSMAEYYPEGTFILGGPSKHLSLGGWRIGVAITPNNPLGQKVMAALNVIASETWSSVAAPIQYAMLDAYRDDPEINDHIDLCTALHGIRTQFLYRELSALGIRCTRPAGGFYLVANFDGLTPPGIRTANDLSLHLLAQHNLATLPGSAFGIPESELSLRLASSYLDMETAQDSERLLSLYRQNPDSEKFMSPHHHPMMHGAIAAFKDFLQK